MATRKHTHRMTCYVIVHGQHTTTQRCKYTYSAAHRQEAHNASTQLLENGGTAILDLKVAAEEGVAGLPARVGNA
jgi:hypothetical protein